MSGRGRGRRSNRKRKSPSTGSDVTTTTTPQQKEQEQQKESGNDSDSDDEFEVCAAGANSCERPRGNAIIWVMCEACGDWYHCSCIKVDAKEAEKEEFIFFCDKCMPIKLKEYADNIDNLQQQLNDIIKRYPKFSRATIDRSIFAVKRDYGDYHFGDSIYPATLRELKIKMVNYTTYSDFKCKISGMINRLREKVKDNVKSKLAELEKDLLGIASTETKLVNNQVEDDNKVENEAEKSVKVDNKFENEADKSVKVDKKMGNKRIKLEKKVENKIDSSTSEIIGEDVESNSIDVENSEENNKRRGRSARNNRRNKKMDTKTIEIDIKVDENKIDSSTTEVKSEEVESKSIDVENTVEINKKRGRNARNNRRNKKVIKEQKMVIEEQIMKMEVDVQNEEKIEVKSEDEREEIKENKSTKETTLSTTTATTNATANINKATNKSGRNTKSRSKKPLAVNTNTTLPEPTSLSVSETRSILLSSALSPTQKQKLTPFTPNKTTAIIPKPTSPKTSLDTFDPPSLEVKTPPSPNKITNKTPNNTGTPNLVAWFPLDHNYFSPRIPASKPLNANTMASPTATGRARTLSGITQLPPRSSQPPSLSVADQQQQKPEMQQQQQQPPQQQSPVNIINAKTLIPLQSLANLTPISKPIFTLNQHKVQISAKGLNPISKDIIANNFSSLIAPNSNLNLPGTSTLNLSSNLNLSKLNNYAVVSTKEGPPAPKLKEAIFGTPSKVKTANPITLSPRAATTTLLVNNQQVNEIVKQSLPSVPLKPPPETPANNSSSVLQSLMSLSPVPQALLDTDMLDNKEEGAAKEKPSKSLGKSSMSLGGTPSWIWKRNAGKQFSIDSQFDFGKMQLSQDWLSFGKVYGSEAKLSKRQEFDFQIRSRQTTDASKPYDVEVRGISRFPTTEYHWDLMFENDVSVVKDGGFGLQQPAEGSGGSTEEAQQREEESKSYKINTKLNIAKNKVVPFVIKISH